MDHLLQSVKSVDPADLDARAAVTDAIQALDLGLVLWDEDLRFVFGNNYWQRTFYPDSTPQQGEHAVDMLRDLVNAGAYEIPDGVTPQMFSDQMMALLRSYAKNIRVNMSGGRVLDASVHRTALGGYLISFRDISSELQSREEAERQRAKTERANTRLRDALESIGEGFALFDQEDRLILANDLYKTANSAAAHLMTFGRPRKEIIEAMTHGGDIIGVEDWIESYDRESQVGDTSSPRRYEVHHADGRVFLASRGRTAEGGCTITWLDITNSKKTEARARAIANDAMEALDEGFALFDADMRFEFCNQNYKDVVLGGELEFSHGMSMDEVIEVALDSGIYVTPGTSRDAYVAAMKEFARTYQKNVEFVRKDGRIFEASAHQTGLGGFLITARDVTEQRELEAQRRRVAERELEVVTDTMQSLITAIALFDADLNFVMGNPGYFEMWYHKAGIAPAEPGESLTSILDRMLDASYFTLPEGVDRAMAHHLMMQSVESFGKNVPLETRAGSFVGHVSPAGNGGYLVEFSDLTDQRQAETELQRQREAAHQNEKLSAMGELLAGVAHELNNPLSIVVGYAMMMQSAVSEPKMKRQVDNIAQAAERCSRIVKAFLAMARQRPTELKRCSLNELLMAALDMVGHRLRGAGIEVILELDEGLPDVDADEDQIIQVLTNLILNAEHALTETTEPRRLTLRTFHAAADRKAVIVVADNGPGISDAVKSRIFEPFFTTKDVGTGTGIGLAFCHRVIDSHGWRITIQSPPGTGAQFEIRLDAATGASTPTLDDSAEIEGISGNVLVVDDETGVADLIGDILTEAGYQIQTRNSGTEALELLRTQRFDAVLSDIKMPGLDGPAFFSALSDIDPEMASRTGFITGDTLSRDVAAFLASTRQPYLEKPVTPSELLNLVNDLIERSRS